MPAYLNYVADKGWWYLSVDWCHEHLTKDEAVKRLTERGYKYARPGSYKGQQYEIWIKEG